MVFFYQMHGLIRWEKCQLFLLFDLVVFKALKGVFFLEYRKRHFFLPILPLKKVREMAIFKRNSRVNQFQKMSIFCFLSSCIYSLQKCFFFLDYRKRHVLGYFALKKLEEWLFLEQNHGLTPFKICQFFDFLNFLFL